MVSNILSAMIIHANLLKMNSVLSNYKTNDDIISNSKAKNAFFKTDNKVNTDKDIPDAQVYYQSWIKYFHYQKGKNKLPRNFFRNKLFKDQLTYKNKAVDNKNPIKDNVNYT